MHMHELNPIRARLGTLALGLAALLFAAFPLVRPFFPLDPAAPDQTLSVASPAIASVPWVVSHLTLMLAFVLLLYGMLTLYAYLGDGQGEPRALRAMVLSLAGIALIMPMLGVETHILPIIGTLYLEGKAGIAPAVGLIYHGPALAVFLLGLLLLAIGAILFAVAIWHSVVLPRWAGVLFAIGLALWFPPFPRMIRMVDGLVIGMGGVWLAWSLWQTTPGAAPRLQRGG
jgi:hypothetical protein